MFEEGVWLSPVVCMELVVSPAMQWPYLADLAALLLELRPSSAELL